MEFLGARIPFTQFQEEKYQLLELNQRLESYLGRVKLLEEENKLLREEIHTLKSSREATGQRKAQEDALSQARCMLEEAWRKKDHVELEVENLIEDIEVVSIQRQKVKNAQADAQRKLMESKKELEEERRAQIWLREKVGQLEKDLLLQMQVHQENMETMQASLKQTKLVLMAPHLTKTTIIPDLGQEYSHRAAQAWQEATNNYQRLAGRLEESLNEAKANMAKIHQEKKENQHQVQHLGKELESTKTKRQMLEKNLVQQREEHKQELHHLQAQVDALELEKDSMGQQIDSLMVDRQNLLQVKMSLGLEVATYRALLDSEGLRIDRPTTKKTSSAFFLDVLSKPTGTHPASQTTAASCHVSNTVSTSHRSITSSRTLLTSATPAWTPTRGTPQRTPIRASVTEKTEVHISEETEKASEKSVDYLQQEKVQVNMALTTTLPKTAAEPEPQLKPEDTEIQEEGEPKQSPVIESKTDESALISVSAEQLSNLSQTPELESWTGPFTDPAEVSEEGKDEDTEVSVEMARISHAPKVAWEENKTVAEDEKDDASEMDVRSENISESHIDAYGDAENDNDTIKSSHISANTSILGSSFLERGTLDLVGDFGYHEDLMKTDELDNVSNISEEVTEQMNSEPEAAIDSINEWGRQEEIEPENETKVMSPDSEVEEDDAMNIDADTKDKAEGVTEREEEIEVIKSDISAQDEGVGSPKSSGHQESLENTVPSTKPHSDETVNEDPSLEESEGEEVNQSEDDNSPNVSASWRTDPDECDSYSQENTLADTRPLIRYKSDEETDGNVQALHLIGETSDSEDEKERMEAGHWNESASKRFNTMEDLTEEPDMEVTGELMTETVVSKKEALDDDKACTMFQSDSEVHECLDMVVEESARIELKGSLEDSDVKTEMMTEDVSKEEALDGDRSCTMLQSDSEVHESLDLVEKDSARTELKESLEDSGVKTEMMTDVVSKEEALDDDKACMMLQSDSEVHESLDIVQKDSARIELKGSLEEDSDFMTEMMTDDVSKEEALDGDRSCTMLQSDSEVHESLDLVEKESARIELQGNLEEDSDDMTEMMTEDVVSKQEVLDGDRSCTMLQSDSEVHESLDIVQEDSARIELKGSLEEDSDFMTEMMTDDVSKEEALDGDRSCTMLQSDSEVHESLDLVEKESARIEFQGNLEEDCDDMTEMMTEDVVSKQEVLDGDRACTMLQSDTEVHESLDLVEKESARIELQGNLEEDSDDMTEMMTEDVVSKEALDDDKASMMLQSDSEVHECLAMVEKESARIELKENLEDSDVKTEMMTEDISKEEALDGDMACTMLQSDTEVHESLDLVEKENARIELMGNLEEVSDVMTEMRKDEDHDVKVYEQNEQPQLTENQHMHTEQPEYETVYSYESQEHVNIEHPILFPETSHQLKSSFETPSTMFQDAATIKEPEDLLDVSMYTNMDLTDSQPDDMTSDIPNSDQEEGNSSEDESPNASQCFQSTSLLAATALNEQPLTFTNGVPKADSVSDVNNVSDEVLSKEKITEEPKGRQIDDWENSNIWGKSINAPDTAEITQASSMDENASISPVNETEKLEIPNKMPSLAENIFGKFDEHLERTVESFSEKVMTAMDFESNNSGEEEEFQSKEEKSEIHSFFTTNMKDDFWSEGKMKMAATYDPAKTEDQAMVFGAEWRDMEVMPTANGSHKEKMDILKGQDERHKDEQPTQGKMVLSEDSADEGDSWSSGDE
ncbi:nestin [Garra rufa]|uniref:nestin n=1 Tax=Garra rufa TaxID=137080 RepID=UPI003CCE60D3